MRFLALDVGMRRTGVAYLDDAVGIALPLDTISHVTQEELVHSVVQLTQERSIDRVIVGLPLLPSGDEGSQVLFVRSVGDQLEENGLHISYFDERHTTPKKSADFDGDAAAACSILQSFPREGDKKA